MGVAAEDNIDAGDAARQLEVDVHAVMRQQQHRVDLVGVAQAIGQLLQFAVADCEVPVRRKTLGMGDRHIGKGLPDHGHAMAADLLDGVRLENPPRRRVERLRIVEGGFLREVDVLRQEFALEALEIGAQRLFAIGEFPMAGHRLDAEQVGRLHHVGALRTVGEPGALPHVAAVEEQRAFLPDVVTQAVDQRLQMRKAAELAEAASGLFEIDGGEGIGVGTVGPDAEMVEKGAADQMRRPALHLADPDIDAGLAEIDRQQLRMRVGQVQDAGIAETFEIVNGGSVGGAGKARPSARQRGSARHLQKIPAADFHRKLSAPRQKVSLTYFQILPALFFAGRLEDRSFGQRFGLLR